VDTDNRRSFLKGAVAGAVATVVLPATASVSTDNVPPTISNKESLDDIAVGALFWHDKKLFVKLSDSEIDQVYPAIATYA
jgi:hypothetical protein